MNTHPVLVTKLQTIRFHWFFHWCPFCEPRPVTGSHASFSCHVSLASCNLMIPQSLLVFPELDTLEEYFSDSIKISIWISVLFARDSTEVTWEGRCAFPCVSFGAGAGTVTSCLLLVCVRSISALSLSFLVMTYGSLGGDSWRLLILLLTLAPMNF